MDDNKADATVNATIPEKKQETTGDKDYSKLYENKAAELARKEAKWKAELESKSADAEELSKLRKEREAKEEKDKISKGKQNEIIEEMKAKYADYDDLKSFREGILEQKKAKIQDLMEKIPETEKEFVTDAMSEVSSVDKQEKILKGFLERFAKKDRGGEPEVKKPAVETSELTALESKKAKGKLSPSEKVRYLHLVGA